MTKRTNVRFKRYVTTLPFRLLGTAWPAGAARVFERLLLTPSRRGPPGRFDSGLDMSDQPVETPPGLLPSWSWGEGPVILLVHGWNGAAVQWNELTGPLVAAGFRVIAFDAPAHGRARRRKTNVLEWRAAVQSMADRFGPIHGVVGHSFGSLAVALAVQNGVRVRRMALVAPPADLAAVTRSLGRQLGFSDVVSQELLARLGRRLGVRWEDIKSDRVMASLDTPVLVVHDEDDREISWKDGSVVASAAKNGRLLTTRGLGHRRVIRDANVIDAITRFMSDPA